VKLADAATHRPKDSSPTWPSPSRLPQAPTPRSTTGACSSTPSSTAGSRWTAAPRHGPNNPEAYETLVDGLTPG